MAELSSVASKNDYLRILLIEEPEAHLHPQLQTRLLNYLEATAKNAGIQVVITTHSPVLAAAVSLKTIIYLPTLPEPAKAAIALQSFALPQESEHFVSRWLDATKSTLLFAKGVILVEGIAETLLFPQLAVKVLGDYNAACERYNSTADSTTGRKPVPKQMLPPSLNDAGVSVINMNGLYFHHFMRLFCAFDESAATRLPVRCAGATDKDPPKELADATSGVKSPLIPLPGQAIDGTNPELQYVDVVRRSTNVRLYSNQLKTFEYDLAMEGENLGIMARVAAKLAANDGKPVVSARLTEIATQTWAPNDDWLPRGEAAQYLLDHLDKGEFAQTLADELTDPAQAAPFRVPDYIAKAVIWACGCPDV